MNKASVAAELDSTEPCTKLRPELVVLNPIVLELFLGSWSDIAGKPGRGELASLVVLGTPRTFLTMKATIVSDQVSIASGANLANCESAAMCATT
jgi:hypothetical protein